MFSKKKKKNVTQQQSGTLTESQEKKELEEQPPLTEEQENELRRAALEKYDKFNQLKIDMMQNEQIRKEQEERKREETRMKQEEEQRRLAQLREEEERKRRDEELKSQKKEQERRMKQKIHSAWEFRNFQAVEDCIDASEDFEDSMKNGVKVIKYLETFRENARNTVRDIIHELMEQQLKKNHPEKEVDKPTGRVSIMQQKTIYLKKPVVKKKKEEEQPAYKESVNDLLKGEYQFHRNNMLIKIACGDNLSCVLSFPQNSQYHKAVKFKFNEEQCFSFNNLSFLKTIVHSSEYIEQLWNEFKALNYLNDVCYSIRLVDRNFRIKVPLACTIEYLGFCALVIAKPPTPLDDASLTVGPSRLDGQYRGSTKLEKELELIGRALSIKTHTFEWNQREQVPRRRMTVAQSIIEEKRSIVYLSFFTEVHVAKFDEFEQLKALLKQYSDEEIDLFEMRKRGLFYLNRCQDILPNIIDEEYANLIEVYQQIKASQYSEKDHIALIEHCIQSQLFKRARPEFIQAYFETGLHQKPASKTYNPDCYQTLHESNDVHADQLELGEMSKFYKRNYIKEFVNKIDQLEICPLDSHTLRESMKLFGINIKQLSEISRLTEQPHIRQMCEQEMVARSLKKIFLQTFTEEIIQTTEDQIPTRSIDFKNLVEQQQQVQSEPETNTIRKQLTTQIRNSMASPYMKHLQQRIPIQEYMELQYKEHLVDFLNLVFARDSKDFWEQVIFKQVLYDFRYDLELPIKGLCPGGFLFAIQYNFKIKLLFEPAQIFTSTPYSSSNSEEVVQSYHLAKYFNNIPSYQHFFHKNYYAGGESKGSQKKLNHLFTMDHLEAIEFDSQNYSFHELEICKLSSKFNIFKSKGNTDLAIKSLLIRLNTISGLNHSHAIPYEKISIFTDLAGLYWKKSNYSQAISKIQCAFLEGNMDIEVDKDFFIEFTGKRHLPNIFLIRPLILLLEIAIDYYQEYVVSIFDQTIFFIEFCFGMQHHVYAQVFQLMSNYFLNLNMQEDSETMLQSRLLCLIQSLGTRHPLTAQAFMNMGKFKQEIMNHQEDSILHYEKAYFIYETLAGTASKECAIVSHQLSKVYTQCGRNQDALKQVELALTYYHQRMFNNMHQFYELKSIRAENLYKLHRIELAKKESEDFLKYFLKPPTEEIDNKSDFIEEEEENYQQDIKILSLNDKSLSVCETVLQILVQIYFTESSKEHRTFLFQVYDSIQENLAKEREEEDVEISEKDLKYQKTEELLVKIKKMGSFQKFFEKMMLNFIDSTGADANQFIFNFKQDLWSNNNQIKNFNDAVEDFTNFVIILPKGFFTNLFMKIMIN